MYLPKKIYEALPAMYIAIGALFIFGAAYIGIGHVLMVSYLAVGLSCISAGVFIIRVRYKARSAASRS